MILEQLTLNSLNNFIVEKVELFSYFETCKIKGCGKPIKEVYVIVDRNNRENYSYVGCECIKKLAKQQNKYTIEFNKGIESKYIKKAKLNKNDIENWELPF